MRPRSSPGQRSPHPRARRRPNLEPLERRTLLSAALVADINQVPVGSQPELLTPVGSRLFFTANDGVHGTELWASDGTDAGTRMVKDISPGFDGSSITSITDVGGVAWFAADDGVHGKELWRSDGTEAGTYLVADLATGTAAANPASLTPFAGRLYFVAYTSAAGSELWSVDTAPGAVPTMVKDVYAGTTSSNPTGLLAAGGRLYFAAYDAAGGNELWSTAGTAATTARVADIVGGSTSSYPVPMAAIGSKVLFRATAAAGAELWVTDGTSAGTSMVKDINPGPNGSAGNGLWTLRWVTLGDQLLWTADDGVHGAELWRSDGTADGTYLLADIRAGTRSADIYSLAACQGLAYFSATDATSRTALWVSDGTTAGTHVAATAAQLNYQVPSSFCPVGNSMYFLTPRGLWVSDGTSEGTSFVHMFGGGYASSLTAVGTTLYVSSGNVDGTRVELWASDGTDAGTRRVGPDVLAITRSSSPISLTPAGDVLYFSADDGVHGREVWRTDGTAAGTWLLKDINPSATTWAPQDLTWVGGRLYFKAAEDDAPTFGLWMSDGTEAGTVKVLPPAGGSFGDDMVGYKGALYIEGNIQTSRVLWKVDALGAVTLVADLGVAASASVYNMRVSGSLLYFVVNGQLWRSDGTWGGTYSVGTGSNAQFLTDVNGWLYFTASDTTHGTELWYSNGTSAGTYMVRDITPGTASTSMYNFANVGGTLFFAANTYLWKSNGSSASTVQVSTAARYVNYIAGLNGIAYFSATPIGGTDQLWRSDGTSSGTFAVSPQTGGSIYDITAINGYVYADLYGSEVWRADDTAAQAVRIFQSPTTLNTHPGTFTYANGLLFFEVDDLVKGNELYAFYPPVADAGGPYRVQTGSDLRLDASASYDPGGAPLTYTWDLDGDGIYGEVGAAATYGDEVGATPTYHAPATDGLRFVRVQVGEGVTGLSTTASVAIDVAAPPGGSLPPVAAVEGHLTTIEFANPTGRGPLVYSFDFDNDGTWDATSASPSVWHVFPDSGTYVVRGRITDWYGTSTDFTTSATVANAAPTATLPNASGVEGRPVAIALANVADDSLTDMAAGLVYSFDLDNDGVFETAAQFGGTEVVFPDEGTYTVRARVADKDGDASVYIATVVVAGAAPTSSLTGPATVVEGSAGTVAFGPVADVPTDLAAGFTYSFDFDDDGTFEVVGNSSPSIAVPTDFLADGPLQRTVRGRVTDKDGLFNDYRIVVSVKSAPPFATFADSAATAGVPTVLTLTGVSDPSPVDVSAGLLITFDLNSDGTFDTPESTSPFTTAVFATAGPHAVRARVRDKDGWTAEYAATVFVLLPPPPVATFSDGGPVDEGSPGAVSFAAAVGAGPFTYSYDFDNDGTFEVAGSASAEAVVPAAYLADGPFTRTVRGRVTDRFGQSTDYTADILVRNVAPTLVIPAAANGSVILGTGYVLSLAATDPGSDHVSHWHVDWGDGGTADAAAASGLFAHTYAAAGTFAVTATATDDDGSYAATAHVTVTAAPPTAGFAGGSMATDGSAYRFTVAYDDDLGIDAATIGDGDFEVTGPAGTAAARLVSYAPAADGGGHGGVATYEVPSPLGTWSWQDNGSYTVSARPGAVRDLQGIDLPAGQVGGFDVALPAPVAPDLAVQFAGPVPKSIAPNGKYSVTLKLSNHGGRSLPATGVTTRLFLSSDKTLDDGDLLLGSAGQKGALPINGSSSVKVTFASPTVQASGRYYLLAVADATGAVAERDERNNVTAASAGVTVTAPTVDLSTAFATKPKASYKPGDRLMVGVRVTNAGNAAAAGRATLRLYFSADAILDDGDLLVATSVLSLKLKAKGSAVFNRTVKVPASLAGRKWYVFASTDGTAVGDHRASNDLARTGPFTVAGK